MKLTAVYSAFTDPSWHGLVHAGIDHAGERLASAWDERYVYHDLSHTASVIASADELALDAALNEQERALLLIAAAFHDSGYCIDANNHENIGATYAADYLIAQQAPVKTVGLVVHLIQSTALHVHPVNPLQGLLRDADLHYLGLEGFLENAERLRREWELTRNLTYSEVAWTEQNIRFLESHNFHTEQAQKRYNHQKALNLEMLRAHLTAIRMR